MTQQLNIFELRELDELLRDFDRMLWQMDSRGGTQIRLRLHVLIRRVEQLLKDETEKGKG